MFNKVLLACFVVLASMQIHAEEHNAQKGELACFHDYIPHPDSVEELGKKTSFKNYQLKPLNLKEATIGDESDLEDKWFFSSKKPRSTEIGLKILFISVGSDTESEPAVGLVKNTLMAYGVPFEHFTVKNEKGELKKGVLPLYAPNGMPKYYGIIVSNAELGFTDNQGKYRSALSTEQWNDLREYERRYNIRRVSMYTYPNTSMGVQLAGGNNDIPQQLDLAPFAKKLDGAVRDDYLIPLKKAWHYEAEIVDPKIAFPLITYGQDDGTNKKLASIINRFPDGREQMQFFFTQSMWVKASNVLSGMWLNWLTRGHYIGFRRMYLNVQVDDFFLATHLWDPQKNEQTENGRTHRLSNPDFELFTLWQHNNYRKLAKNDSFRIEFAFNGQGALIYRKPNPDKPGSFLEDSLLTLSKNYYSQYHWLSHTYTHADLNFTTYDQTVEELKKNIEFTMNEFLGLLKDFKSYYSHESMVTPKISGLLRLDSLKAIWDTGIHYVTGDNTRAELRPAHPYTFRYTTVKDNGFGGVAIIPRHATEVYYNASIPEELVAEYNFFYEKKLGTTSTLEDIMEREADRVSNNLLRYDPAAYMFHQSNMNAFDYNGKRISLLALWMERVATELRHYTTLPLLSLKMDEMKNVYLRRADFDNCGIEAIGSFQGSELVSVSVQSKNRCWLPLTGSSMLEQHQIEAKYGPDRNVFIPLDGKSKVVVKIKP